MTSQLGQQRVDAHDGSRDHLSLAEVTAELRDAFHELDANLPEGFRAELIDETIIVTLAPPSIHEYIHAKIGAQLLRRSAIELLISGHHGIATPYGNFIPDVLAIGDPATAVIKPAWGGTEGVLLAAGIEPSHIGTGGIGRVGRRRAYAAAEIPLYLLVDLWAREVSLFSDPDVEAQDYRAHTRVPFGSDLELPAPFSFTLTDFTPRM